MSIPQDLGLLAIVEGSTIVGYNLLVGGGFGVTPTAKKTFPAVAKRMAFITPDQVLEVATAVVKVQRDFGNRADRKVARMKYLIANWGLEKFKAKVEEYYGQPLPEPHPDDVSGFDDHLGWHEQGDGSWFYGLNIENGRIQDQGTLKLKTAIREICNSLQPPCVSPATNPFFSSTCRKRISRRSKRSSAATVCRSRNNSVPCAAGRWPARRCRHAAWP